MMFSNWSMPDIILVHCPFLAEKEQSHLIMISLLMLCVYVCSEGVVAFASLGHS